MQDILGLSCLKSLAIGILLLGPLHAAEERNNLQALQDRVAIGELLAQYSYRWDGKFSREFSDLFTEDGRLERKRHGSDDLAGEPVVGREAIYDYAHTAHTTRLADRQSRHHMSGLIFLELTSNSAITQNMAIITHQRAQDATAFISSSGIYRIRWRKTEEGWRMANRLLISDRFVAQPSTMERPED